MAPETRFLSRTARIMRHCEGMTLGPTHTRSRAQMTAKLRGFWRGSGGAGFEFAGACKKFALITPMRAARAFDEISEAGVRRPGPGANGRGFERSGQCTDVRRGLSQQIYWPEAGNAPGG